MKRSPRAELQEEAMRMHVLVVPALLAVVGAVPARGQTPRVAEALQGAGDSLDRYQKLAASFRCDTSDQKFLHDCNETLEALMESAQDARKKVASYHASPRAQKLAALFDVYQAFERITERATAFSIEVESESQSDNDRRFSAQVYNNFVKTTMWLGSVLRDSLGACGPH
jgi:hypothetical protein